MKKRMHRRNKNFLNKRKYFFLVISVIIIFLIYSILASWVNAVQFDYWPGNCVQMTTFIATSVFVPEKNISLESITYEQNPFNFAGFSSYYHMIRYLEKKGIESAFYLNATSADIKKAVDDERIPIPQITTKFSNNLSHFLDANSHFVAIVDYSEENGNLTGFYFFDSWFWSGDESLNYTTPYYMNISEFESRWDRPIYGHIFWVNIEPIARSIGFIRPLTVVEEEGAIQGNWKISTIARLMYASERFIGFVGHSVYNISKIVPYIHF